MNDVFLELSLVIIVVFAVSLLMRLLRQPLLIGHILAGILVGPLVFNIVHTSDYFRHFRAFRRRPAAFHHRPGPEPENHQRCR